MEIHRKSKEKNIYGVKIFFKSGDIYSFYINEEGFNRRFSQSITEGFYPKNLIDNIHKSGKTLVENISRVMVFKDGCLLKNNLPPIWTNHKGYIFSTRGLERIINPDSSKYNIFEIDHNESCDSC